MRRRLFNLAAALSLLLCVATAGFWVHSAFGWAYCGHWTAPSAGFARSWEVGSNRGRIYLSQIWLRNPNNNPMNNWYAEVRRPFDPMPWTGETRKCFGIAGVYWERVVMKAAPHHSLCMAIPDYLLVALFLLLPARGWMKRRLNSPGCCLTCGYDLRASPDRCPECGTAVSAPAGA
jgi:hypothetical protein